jgi:hypothetical protein
MTKGEEENLSHLFKEAVTGGVLDARYTSQIKLYLNQIITQIQ